MFQFQYFYIPKTLSREHCARALQALEKTVKKPQQGIINLIVITPDEMAQMNKQFRGKEGPTDILTFSYREEGKRTRMKGKTNDFLLKTNNQKLITKNFVA